MKILIMTGGGTGGHIIPNLALIPTLKKHFKIYYLGEKDSLEQELISKIPEVDFIPINAVKFVRKFTFKNLAIPFKMLKNIRECKKLLKEIKPDVIFAKGGYVSLPVVFAGAKLKVPILSHESDFSMGLANKLILKKAEVVFTSFRETCLGNKCVYSGSPVRKEIFTGNKEKAQNICNFKNQTLKTLLFFGGSIGSRAINKFVEENFSAFKNYNVIHFVGKKNMTNIKADNYFQIEFAENIYDFYALADLVIARAGANSIFELLALKKLMILIPLGKEVSRGDQIENAKVFAREGYALVLDERDLSIDVLLKKIENSFKNKLYFIDNMKSSPATNANKIITDYVLDVAEDKKIGN